MKKAGAKEPSAAKLRRVAAERLHERTTGGLRAGATPDPERLIQELQIHQIELEMQNEELRRARNELEVALARSTELYDFAPVGYVTLDPGGKILEINLVGATMLDKERSRVIGQRFAPCVAPAARPALEAFLGELREGADKASCDLELAPQGDRPRHVRLDGTRDPTVQGTDWRCRTAMTDVTQRKEMEDKLRRQRARLGLRYDLTAALSSAATIADVSRVVFDHGLTAFEADAGALVIEDEQDAGTLQIVANLGYPEALIEAWRRFPVTLPSPVTDAYRTGAAVWVESSAAALSGFPEWAPAVSSGADRAWAALPLQIGERTFGVLGLGFRHERAFDDEDRAFIETLADRCAQALDRARLLESERRARLESDRVGELQRLTLGVVGHDLRSPLQVIKMSAVLLVKRGDLTPEQAERVLRISRGAARIAGIIRDLLDYTRARQGETLPIERQRMDLSALCQDIVHETRSIHPDREIAFEDSGECLGEWDPARVGQVLSNLLSNALHHGGLECRVRVSLAADEGAATLTVFNDGPPIPREAQEAVFEPYRRADAGPRKQGTGLGLGLFIIREIARAHGGDVALQSEEGGTSFIVRLPGGGRLEG